MSYNLFKLLRTKEIVKFSFSKYIIYFLHQKDIRKTTHDFSVFFPRHVNILCRFVNATVTKYNPPFDTLFFSKNALYLFLFFISFFLFLLLYLLLVGRILQMQLRHFYIVATSRIITRSIYI